MYPGMRTDQKVAQNVLAVKNNFIAVRTDSFLLFTTNRAQNLTFFTGSVFFPSNAGFEKGVFVREVSTCAVLGIKMSNSTLVSMAKIISVSSQLVYNVVRTFSV
jgi:hypothetical protein